MFATYIVTYIAAWLPFTLYIIISYYVDELSTDYIHTYVHSLRYICTYIDICTYVSICMNYVPQY